MRVTGRKLIRSSGGEEVPTFVPEPLPPRSPALEMGPKRSALLARAEEALARLEVAGGMVPSIDWFVYAFVRKEAVFSSQIEGTQVTLVDLLEYEVAKEESVEDVREVCNYLDALEYARREIKKPKGLPLSASFLL